MNDFSTDKRFNNRFTNISTELLFIFMNFGTGFMLSNLKTDVLVIMLVLGFLALSSILVKSFTTSIIFYLFLAMMIFINVIFIKNVVIDNPNTFDIWSIYTDTEKISDIPNNIVWGVLIGLVLSPVLVFFYHKKIHRNQYLEVAFTVIFIVVTLLLFISRLSLSSVQNSNFF